VGYARGYASGCRDRHRRQARDEACGAAAPTGGAPAGENRYTQWYEVKSGDTLWKIAKEHYGDGNLYTEIFKANQDVLTDPTRSRSDRSCGFPESPL
jgi:nucleoid-associated protein YgaU